MADAVQEQPQEPDKGESSEKADRRWQRRVERMLKEQEQQEKEAEKQEAEKHEREEAERTAQMRAEKREERKRDRAFNDLMVSYNIDYEAPTERFSGIRQAVANLGCRTYHDWRGSNNVSKAPWRREMVMRVKKLVEAAHRRRLYGPRYIETTWGMMEYDIFKNFRYKSNCNACHKRLWQPDILPEPIRLHNRKENETPKADCSCGPEYVKVQMSSRLHDGTKPAKYFLGEGTELCDIYESNYDRIFYLFPSNSLENYRQRLSSMTSHKARVQDLLSELEKSRHSLFPFLVCVVDLSGDPDTHKTLRYRVASSLHSAIVSQYRLSQAADSAGTVFKPLAWCITYESVATSKCVLFIACLRTAPDGAQEDPDRPPIRIMRLWEGELTDMDSALQLLLLLDYIAEWAKAFYSKCVVQCLRFLVARTDRERRHTATILYTGITPPSSSVDTLPEDEQDRSAENVQDGGEDRDGDEDEDEGDDNDDKSSESEDSRVARFINDKEKTFHPSVWSRNRHRSS